MEPSMITEETNHQNTPGLSQTNTNHLNQEFQKLTLNQEASDLPAAVKAELQEVHDRFYVCLDEQDIQGLVGIIKYLRESLASPTNPLTARVVIELGVLPPLVNLLMNEKYSQERKFQVELFWLLANICAGTSEDVQFMVETLNIIPILVVAFGQINDDEIQENIMWALSNLAGESNLMYRNMILEEGMLDLIQQQLTTSPKRILYYRTAAWLMSNLVRGSPFPPFDKVRNVFGHLVYLMDCPDITTQEYVLLALTFLSEEAQDTHIKSFYDYHLIPKIIKSISNTNQKVATHALKVVGNIAKRNKSHTQPLYDGDIYKALSKSLLSEDIELRRQSCITLSNLLNNQFDDHDFLIDYQTLDAMIELALQEDKPDIKAEAVLCLSKFLVNAMDEDALLAIEKGAVDVFLNSLQADDVRVIENSLTGLYNVLQYGERMQHENNGENFVVKKIIEGNSSPLFENLMTHSNRGIAEQTLMLYYRFFQQNF